MNRWTSTALHEELALIYSQFRGVPAPVNAATESLWRKIVEMEHEEDLARAARR